MNRFSALLFLFVLALPGEGRGGEAEARLRLDVLGLVAAGVVPADAGWGEQAVEGKMCDGEQVAGLLMQLAGVFEPAPDLARAVSVLAGKKVVWNDYWTKHAIPGGQCEGRYVANLLHAAAEPVAAAALVKKYAPTGGIVPVPEPSAFSLAGAAADAAGYNYVIGTQTIGASYQFTGKTRLVETAEEIRTMGSTVIKFELTPRYAGERRNVTTDVPAITSLAALARDEPSHRRVLDMPFAVFVLWSHTFCHGEDKWHKGFSTEAADAEYREMYDLTTHLLRTYAGSGKTFLLGHWEGDGFLRHSVAAEDDARVTDAAAQGMADWLNTRQRAVDDAKRDTPHEKVEVWHYTEVNHVKLAMLGRPALVNRVLPGANVDLVSYSSYDTQGEPPLLKAALGFIETQLPAKPGLTGRRVFIGEYGFPTVYHTPAEQDQRSRQVLQAGLEWGCPLILYWELFNNEVTPEGKQRGFWLIDDRGLKQPVYKSHATFLEWGRREVAQTREKSGHAPTAAEFRAAAVKHLGQP